MLLYLSLSLSFFVLASRLIEAVMCWCLGWEAKGLADL